MLFIIQDREYAADSIQDASITDMLLIKRQTGFSMDAVQAALEDLAEKPITELDEAGLVALAVMIWIARRKAGERDISIEQAADFPLRDLEIRHEPGDAAAMEAEVPNPAARRRAARKTTAKPRSNGSAA